MLLAVALLLAITLPAWIKQARSDKTDGDFALNCLGLGVALSAVVQIAAFFALGLGSPYAIKKHAFLVGTLLVMIAALRTIRLTPLRGAVGRLHGGRLLSGPAPAFALATIAVFLIFPWHSKPLAPFLGYDLEVRALISGTSDLQGSTISANKDFPHRPQSRHVDCCPENERLEPYRTGIVPYFWRAPDRDGAVDVRIPVHFDSRS